MSTTIKQSFRRLLVKHHIQRTRSLDISGPTDFKHLYHIGLDQTSKSDASLFQYLNSNSRTHTSVVEPVQKDRNKSKFFQVTLIILGLKF